MRHYGVRLVALSAIVGVCTLLAFNIISSGFNYKDAVVAGVMIVALGAVALIAAILDGRQGSNDGSR